MLVVKLEALSGSQGYLKEVQRMFEGTFRKISGKNDSIVLQECSNEVLFCNFFLHDTHRSYPSRRRACSIQSPKSIKVSINFLEKTPSKITVTLQVLCF